jgi:hypothetical protein
LRTIFTGFYPPFVGFHPDSTDSVCTAPAIRYIFASSNFKNTGKMKTMTLTIATLLTLQAGILFAGNETASAPVTNESTVLATASFAPVTPAEATFEDFTTVIEITALQPLTPAEASFEDMPSGPASITDLAPVTPAVADFTDAPVVTTVDPAALAPVAPSEADFE